MKVSAVAAVLFLARAASAQVTVNVHLAKPEFIAGEPVHVVVDVTNISDDVFVLRSCCWDVRVAVPSGQRRVLPSFDSCHPLGDVESKSSQGMPPAIRLRPGETFSYWSLLRGYALEAGTYAAIAEGTVNLRRESTVGRSSEQTRESASFVHILDLRIQAGSDAALRQAFAVYVTDSREVDGDRGSRAIDAIIEMAPAFLEDIIATQASRSIEAIDALTLIGTRDARERLKAVYALQAVARIGGPEDLDFLNR